MNRLVQERRIASAQAGDVPSLCLPALQGLSIDHPDSIPDRQVSPRRRLRAARRALSASQQRTHAARAVALLMREPLLRGAPHVALYRASDGELDPSLLLHQTWPAGRRWYLPVLHPYLAGRLWFVGYQPDRQMRPNRFGILEPMCRGRHLCPAKNLNLVFLPLVGFDEHCNRIGMGGGFYDRSFAFLRQRRCWRRPLLVGLAHECQRLDRIEPKPWDLPLNAVVTERRIYWRST